MKLRRMIAAGVVATLATTGLAACSSSDAIRIGTTDSARGAWKVFEDKAADAGINLKTTEFGDYSTPNDALAQGELDVNLFQHLKFLANYNVGADQDLTPIGSTEIVPLALFWKDHSSLTGIEGQTIAIPNDTVNQGRAINVLVQAGLLTLKSQELLDPTPADIDEAASKVSVTTVDAAQTSVTYGEGRPSIINNNFLDRAGIDPHSAIYQDDPKNKLAEPYINVFVTKAEDKDNEDIAKLVEIWHDPEVQAAVQEDSKGTSVPVKRPAEELQGVLDKLEDDLRAAK
ncbi:MULTISPECIES: MetQ/NlpA family ABC transporter substrate-binding protein [unclassified Corynebacterium]|uniref:MetQ/NlpA family ABC transporter substrate-binding protein n=1 Tax=unclassified Corynebacterium TaxID=2624378 RepID=UPI0029CA3BE6|nr:MULTISPECIES: MetQ/NlpA family ABC transporter substrate-binding protein [unclassified Corynebacterium]WPF66575.1 MetQ/NlpA family ABC transporter substrate-binding protein [Corynebacterium sp. 22KM0430]WPF69064.1 MetQ/NlpA family ABC transporter substrate-binding protein [Corynebacterium sp. 21KM1197]